MQKKSNNLQKEILYLFVKTGLFLVIGWIILNVIFGICQNIGDDMFPMVKNGDLVVYFRLQKEYHSDELVVIKINGQKQIRRIKAMGGDEVAFDENKMTINGYFQQEESIYKETYAYENEITFPIKLKKNEYFVLGDNRDEAEDSRVYGPIKYDDILGSVITVVRRNSF